MGEEDQFVALRVLARELRIDRSHFRRYVIRLGITPQKRHTLRSGNQLVVTVTAQEAEQIRIARRGQGYNLDYDVLEAAVGVFYVVQLIPELDPNRVKLGFADDAGTRLVQHRTAAPTAKLVKTWPCKRSWEFTVIDSLATAGCKLILNEVYECDDVARLIEHGDRLFALLPDPTRPVELSAVSPNNNQERANKPSLQPTSGGEIEVE